MGCGDFAADGFKARFGLAAQCADSTDDHGADQRGEQAVFDGGRAFLIFGKGFCEGFDGFAGHGHDRFLYVVDHHSAGPEVTRAVTEPAQSGRRAKSADGSPEG